MDMSLFSSSDEYSDQPIETISRKFNRQLDLQSDDDSTVSTSNLFPHAEAQEEENDNDNNNDNDDDEDDDDDGDFTFMIIGGDDSAPDGDKVFEDGRIQPVFPLFDQKLLLDGEYEVEEIDRLPIQPPVDKIFIQSPRRFPSSSASESDQNKDGNTGPYCVWSKESATATTTAELSKKSNSTGFSKLWRLKDKGGRSNSYGRDAFVFFKSSDKKTTTTTTTTATAAAAAAATTASSSSAPATVDRTFKVNVAGGKAKVVKGKKPTVSAHEAYMKSRGGHSEEERRRSYLPYRPELMGFFTNVHGGLTKNVHPY